MENRGQTEINPSKGLIIRKSFKYKGGGGDSKKINKIQRKLSGTSF